MSITAKVIEDSISPSGKRLTTYVLRYPRFIHADFMTHRVFSRNASSSRAQPVAKVLSTVVRDPATPIFWGKNQPGMMAAEELQGWRRSLAKRLFLGSRYVMVGVVWALDKLGLHKQTANRLLEPWHYITTIVTATEWENFFNLRLDKNAQPEMQELALQMYVASFLSEWKGQLRRLGYHEWHLPFVSDSERSQLPVEVLRKLSVARCARVSYLLHDGTKPNAEKDVELHDRLLKGGHMSPFEHQAQAIEAPGTYGNLRGWESYRKTIPGEAVYRRSL